MANYFFIMGMEASVVYWRFDYIIYVYNFQEIAQTMGGWQCRFMVEGESF